MKDNAVKSEIDKNNELCRSAVRVVVTLAKLAEHGMLKEFSKILYFILFLITDYFYFVGGSTPKFDAFVRDTKVGQWGEQYNIYNTELESKEFGHGDTMDLS
jgi:hypothetical protein